MKEKDEIEYHKQYYQDNKDQIKQYRKNNKEKIKRYSEDNREKIGERSKQQHNDNRTKRIKTMKQYNNDNKERSKQYYQDNKERSNLNQRIRIKNDKLFAIKLRLRNRLRNALKAYSKNGKVKTSMEYGIDYKAIIEHLKPFPENRELYHIDHIKPLCSFNFEDKEEIKKAFAPENHQWLLAGDNLSKGGRYYV